MGSAGGGLVEGQPLPTAFALFLVQVIIIISLAKLTNFVLKPLKQPAVVGEMLAGIILGPTVLGRVPQFTATLFPDASIKILQVISSFGLCFFMFLVGLELDADKIKRDLKLCLSVSGTGLAVPFVASLLLSLMFHQPQYVSSGTSFGVLALFLTCALGISALPVLARILSERRMLQTRLGSLSMCIAAVDDVMAWVLLAVCIAIVRAASELDILWVFLLTVGECILMWVVVRPTIAVLVRRGGAFTQLSADTFLLLCLVLILCCWFTEVIGLSSLIGAFQVGLLIPRNSSLSHALCEKFEYFTVGILMPLYFCNSGLRTQFGLINSWETFGVAVLIIVVATVSKVLGITLPCIYVGIPARISVVIGILMSCKGLIALIVVNFGLDYGVITPKFFAILVLMVLVTTMMTIPLVQCVDPPSRAKQSAAEAAVFEASFDPSRAAKKRDPPATGADDTGAGPDGHGAKAGEEDGTNGTDTIGSDSTAVVTVQGAEPVIRTISASGGAGTALAAGSGAAAGTAGLDDVTLVDMGSGMPAAPPSLAIAQRAPARPPAMTLIGESGLDGVLTLAPEVGRDLGLVSPSAASAEPFSPEPSGLSGADGPGPHRPASVDYSGGLGRPSSASVRRVLPAVPSIRLVPTGPGASGMAAAIAAATGGGGAAGVTMSVTDLSAHLDLAGALEVEESSDGEEDDRTDDGGGHSDDDGVTDLSDFHSRLGYSEAGTLHDYDHEDGGSQGGASDGEGGADGHRHGAHGRSRRHKHDLRARSISGRSSGSVHSAEDATAGPGTPVATGAISTASSIRRTISARSQTIGPVLGASGSGSAAPSPSPGGLSGDPSSRGRSASGGTASTTPLTVSLHGPAGGLIHLPSLSLGLGLGAGSGPGGLPTVVEGDESLGTVTAVANPALAAAAAHIAAMARAEAAEASRKQAEADAAAAAEADLTKEQQQHAQDHAEGDSVSVGPAPSTASGSVGTTATEVVTRQVSAKSTSGASTASTPHSNRSRSNTGGFVPSIVLSPGPQAVGTGHTSAGPSPSPGSSPMLRTASMRFAAGALSVLGLGPKDNTANSSASNVQDWASGAGRAKDHTTSSQQQALAQAQAWTADGDGLAVESVADGVGHVPQDSTSGVRRTISGSSGARGAASAAALLHQAAVLDPTAAILPPAGRAQPVALTLGISDPSQASSLVAVANMFLPHSASAAAAGSATSAMTTTAPAQTPATATLALVWAQSNVDMPSAYMNSVERTEDIRDPGLQAALARSKFAHAAEKAAGDEADGLGLGLGGAGGERDGLLGADGLGHHGSSQAGPGGGLTSLSVFPSANPWEDTLDSGPVAGTGAHAHHHDSEDHHGASGAGAGAAVGSVPIWANSSTHFVLVHHRLLQDRNRAAVSVFGSITAALGLGGTRDKDSGASGEEADVAAVVRKVLSTRLPGCGAAVLFDHGSTSSMPTPRRVLVPVEAGSRSAQPALAFLGRTCADHTEVHVLNVSEDGSLPVHVPAPVLAVVAGNGAQDGASGSAKTAGAGAPPRLTRGRTTAGSIDGGAAAGGGTGASEGEGPAGSGFGTRHLVRSGTAPAAVLPHVASARRPHAATAGADATSGAIELPSAGQLQAALLGCEPAAGPADAKAATAATVQSSTASTATEEPAPSPFLYDGLGEPEEGHYYSASGSAARAADVAGVDQECGDDNEDEDGGDNSDDEAAAAALEEEEEARRARVAAREAARAQRHAARAARAAARAARAQARAAFRSALALSGRPNVKHFTAAARSLAEALDRVLRASPTAYPLVVLGAQLDYHGSVVAAGDATGAAGAEAGAAGLAGDDGSAAAARSRSASVLQPGSGPVPEHVLTDIVSRLVDAWRACAAAKVPVLVVFAPPPPSRPLALQPALPLYSSPAQLYGQATTGMGSRRGSGTSSRGGFAAAGLHTTTAAHDEVEEGGDVAVTVSGPPSRQPSISAVALPGGSSAPALGSSRGRSVSNASQGMGVSSRLLSLGLGNGQ